MLKDWKKIQAPEEQELEKRLRDAREVLWMRNNCNADKSGYSAVKRFQIFLDIF